MHALVRLVPQLLPFGLVLFLDQRIETISYYPLCALPTPLFSTLHVTHMSHTS